MSDDSDQGAPPGVLAAQLTVTAEATVIKATKADGKADDKKDGDDG